MISAEQIIDSLCSVMLQEIQLLDLLADRERELQNQLLNRDWHQLQVVIEEMNRLSEDIERSEQLRNDAFSALCRSHGTGPRAGFAELIGRLDEKSATRLRTLYRSLKVSVMRIRSLTGGIDAYVTAGTTTMRSFLEESSPDHRGTIYGRDGNAGNGRTHAVVVDRHL